MAAQGYPACGQGWRDLLDRVCLRIAAALTDGDTFQVVQVKEKFGTLRFCWRGKLSDASRQKVEEAIDLAEARSACACEQCGEEGRLYRAGGVLSTCCAAHAKGQPVAIKPGFENVHLVRRIVGGQSRVTYRRYDRTTDSFVDVDPGTLAIEEK
ncbi:MULTISPECIES: hypothetical protein [unclassified Bradyrhizobium]|uniref:hypothetical protein n=1 Tax=unclassified Bradyrhizobium TaxID=2631580 RepID=UPI002FEE8038